MTSGSTEMNGKSRPVFISVQTSAYSGATLLSFLLGAHPQIATVGEMNGLIARSDPETYLCSCGERIKECAFWRAVVHAMRSKGFAFDVARFGMKFNLGGPWLLQRLRVGSFRNNALDSLRDTVFQMWPGERRQIKALVARNEAFIRSVLEVTGKQVFVDTSKDPLRLNALRRYSDVDVRAIHLVRDVRGVVASQIRRAQQRANSDVDVGVAAQQWVKLHQRVQSRLGAWSAGKHIRLRYEDLCQDVPGTLARLFQFCSVDPDVQIADFWASPHHIVGNAMRLRKVSEIRLDEQWRSLLTRDQLNTIERVAGALSHQYGYI